jgi:site-specific DNA-cytosine methylase
MNVLSLFDGMSCGQIALNNLGLPVNNYFASEIDLYAMKVTEKNFPQTKFLGQVEDVLNYDLPKIDLLIAGSPCQGFSFNGKQLAFEDPRSKLYFEFLKILKKLKPRYFLLENVPMKKVYEKVINEELGQPKVWFSTPVAPQRRKRLYWTNIPCLELTGDFPKLYRNGIPMHRWSKSWRMDGSFDERIYADGIGNTLTCSINGTSAINFFPPKILDFKPRKVWSRSELFYHKIQKDWMITPEEAEEMQNVPRGYTVGVSKTQRYKMLGNGWTVKVIEHILGGII